MNLKAKQVLVAAIVSFFMVLMVNSYAEVSTMGAKGSDRTAVDSEDSGEGCTIEKFSVYSKSMEREIKVVVILPPEYKSKPEKKYPILYTFHGMGAPYDTFSQMSPLRKALKDKPMIVTCMDADRASWYLDSANLQKDYTNEGKKKGAPKLPPVKSLFTTFFFEEFIPCVDKYYRVNSAQRMMTGFSMGGFGAFHYMLTKPGMFASVSSLSGGFSSLIDDENGKKWFSTLLGSLSQNRAKYEETDLYYRIKKLAAKKEKLPPVFLHCGTEDSLMASNVAMNDCLQKNGFSSELLKTAGKHDWAFWVGASKGVIDFHWKSLK